MAVGHISNLQFPSESSPGRPRRKIAVSGISAAESPPEFTTGRNPACQHDAMASMTKRLPVLFAATSREPPVPVSSGRRRRPVASDDARLAASNLSVTIGARRMSWHDDTLPDRESLACHGRAAPHHATANRLLPTADQMSVLADRHRN